MPTILVVDDSAVDRRLVGGLLTKQPDWQVDYATDGLEAVEKIAAAPPDLVLTDLVMPQMDGLELVAAVRGRFPTVPVVLMTSRGSEEIAVQALRQGAASYVPKRLLAASLVETLHGVLAVTRRRQSRVRLLNCMRRCHSTFTLGNDPSLIEPLVCHLQDSLVQMGICDDAECIRVGVALEEAMANALFHGNLEVGSELRGEDDSAYYALIECRCRQVPYMDRQLYVEADLSRDEAVFIIRDEGPGFDPQQLPDPTDPANLERTCGRGVLLMRAFMDEVTYFQPGNAVKLLKRRPSAAPVSAEATL
jgi:CheY-like chemotaxis protein